MTAGGLAHSPRRVSRRLVVASGLGSPLLFAGCSGGRGVAAPPGTSSTELSARYGPPGPKHQRNGDDVMFAMMLIPHDRQALGLLDLRLQRGALGGLEDVIAEARPRREARIPFLESWVIAWGERVPEILDAHRAHLPGMAQRPDLQALAAAEGAAFDATWLRLMLAHDRGVVAMCEQVIAQGRYDPLKRFATDTADAMRAELTAFEAARPT